MPSKNRSLTPSAFMFHTKCEGVWNESPSQHERQQRMLIFHAIYLQVSQKGSTFAPQFERMHFRFDSLAQQVEHNTFNVGVLGSSPKRIT